MNSDLIELLSSLAARRVRYLVVGGHAVAKYGEPRYTKDVDLWIDNSKANAKKVYDALSDFGAPTDSIAEDFFTHDDHFLKIGKEPLRVDIICGMQGMPFNEAWKTKIKGELFGVRVWFIGLKNLIKLKETAGRAQDLLDVKKLTALRPRIKPNKRKK